METITKWFLLSSTLQHWKHGLPRKCSKSSFEPVRNLRCAVFAQIFSILLKTSTRFLLYFFFDTVAALVYSINIGSFQNSFLCNFHCQSHGQIEDTLKHLSVTPISQSVQCFCMEPVGNLFCVPSFATIVQFRYSPNLLKKKGYGKLFLLAVLYCRILSRYVILCTHRALYVGRVIFHRESPTLSISCNTSSMNATHLKLPFSMRFSAIKRYIWFVSQERWFWTEWNTIHSILRPTTKAIKAFCPK